jgi:hypothetical protein
MTLSNDEVNALLKEKHECIRKVEKKEMTEEEYKKRTDEIDKIILDRNIEIMNTKRDATEEIIAEIMHNVWVEWSRELAENESLSDERLKRWSGLWIPYEKLSDKMKDADRIHAKKVINLDKSVKEGLFVKYKAREKDESPPETERKHRAIETGKREYRRVKPYAKRGPYKKRGANATTI